jgi:hypothetical protein
VFWVSDVEQLCDVNADGITDQMPVMPSVVVLNYGFATELPIGNGAGPLTDLGDLTRVYEGIPFVYGWEICVGSLFGTATVRQAMHGFDFDYVEDVAVAVDDGSEGLTDSTGGYQIKNVDEGLRAVTFSKTGFFDLDMEATVECGKETKLDPELICAVPLFVTVEDTAGNPIPGATVSAEVEFEVNQDLFETYTTEATTDNAGEVDTMDVAGAGEIDLTVSAAGHDTKTVLSAVDGPDAGGDDANGDCYATPEVGVQLCKWNTVVGTIEIGGMPAEGYTLKAIQMSNPDLPVVDEDVTTMFGVRSGELEQRYRRA